MMGRKRSNTFDIQAQRERKSGVRRLQRLRKKKTAHPTSQKMIADNTKRAVEKKHDALKKKIWACSQKNTSRTPSQKSSKIICICVKFLSSIKITNTNIYSSCPPAPPGCCLVNLYPYILITCCLKGMLIHIWRVVKVVSTTCIQIKLYSKWGYTKKQSNAFSWLTHCFVIFCILGARLPVNYF